jgi:glycosyltransferase involved in cell wall biosynthesis
VGVHVLLVEPWFGGSHRAWAEGLRRHSTHEVQLVTHPDRYWRWRTEGSAVTLAAEITRHVAEQGRPDVVLVSTMVDVAALLGLARASIGDVPVVHYVHESQLLYPPADGRALDRSAALRGWSNQVAADHVVFNSVHHRDALFAALPSFLRSFPDEQHDHLVEVVATRSSVLPVGVDVDELGGTRRGDGGPPVVLWNHRWEHDKQPDVFAAAVEQLDDQCVPFRLALAGARPTTPPAAFESLRARLGDRLLSYGDLPRAAYVQLLQRTDVVVSTARHELFGIAVCEAAAAGAAPVLPNRLSYPEVLPNRLSYPEVLPSSIRFDANAGLVAGLTRLLQDPQERATVAARCQAEAGRFGWRQIAPAYDEMLERVVG